MSLAKKPTTTASSNKKIFYGGKYKIAASTKTESIVIYRRQADGTYRKSSTVSGAQDNYRAAVKRISRMHEREAAAARISEAVSILARSSRKRAVDKPKQSLEITVKDALDRFAQASFTLSSNVPGLARRYTLRAVRRKSPGKKSLTTELTLYLVQTYSQDNLVRIESWLCSQLGSSAIATALKCATDDAQNLSQATFVVFTRGDHSVGESDTVSTKHTAYVSDRESITHLNEALNATIAKFFARVSNKSLKEAPAETKEG